MTPAIKALERAKVRFTLHRYEHESSAESFGKETVTKLGVPPERVFKTLVAAGDNGRLVMAMVPVSGRLNVKALAAAMKCKRADLADPAKAEGATGYVVGGISPLGRRKALPAYIDRSAGELPTVFISAGRRGMQIELAPADLIRLTRATPADLAADEKW